MNNLSDYKYPEFNEDFEGMVPANGGGGSGGGGSVEPLIVEIGAVDGQEGTFMKEQAKTIYDAFSSGTPVVLIIGGIATKVCNLIDAVNAFDTTYTFHYLNVTIDKRFTLIEYKATASTDFPKLPQGTAQ